MGAQHLFLEMSSSNAINQHSLWLGILWAITVNDNDKLAVEVIVQCVVLCSYCLFSISTQSLLLVSTIFYYPLRWNSSKLPKKIWLTSLVKLFSWLMPSVHHSQENFGAFFSLRFDIFTGIRLAYENKHLTIRITRMHIYVRILTTDQWKPWGSYLKQTKAKQHD
jgi:hypothetical protein